MSPPVRVTAMRPRHLDRVLAIEEVAYPRPWPRGIFQTELDRADRCYLVARRGRALVGYVGGAVGAGELHVLTLAVAPHARGRGVGARLLGHVLEAACGRGASAATLEVRPSNAAARSLYRRHGFVEEGRRVRYYADTHEDAIIMWLRDLHTRPWRSAGTGRPHPSALPTD